jgi:hypothetical protein
MNPIPTKQENTTMNLQRSPNITTCLLVLPSTSLKRYGITRVVPDTTFPVLSCLASKFFQTLESPIYGTLSASALNRISFMLAVTCVHEAVHVVFYSSDLVESVGRGGRGEAMVPEPIVEDFDPEAELGCALEYYFFGGRLEFNGLPSDISGGVGVIWEPQQRTSDMDALLLEHEANIWLIPSCSISCMLGPTTWTPGRRITNLFNLEPTPLRAMTTSVEGIQGRKFDEPYRRQLRSVRLGARKTRTRSRHERSSLDTDGWPDRG